MKEIIVVRSQLRDTWSILVDDEDYEELNKYKWFIKTQDSDVVYAGRKATKEERAKGYPTTVLMHRQILEVILEPTLIPDHKDMDGLNNTKENLRLATRTQNNANKNKYKNCSSVYKGVTKRGNKWVVEVRNKRIRYHLGYFTNELDAAIAYNNRAKELFGEFARLNNIKEITT